MKRQKIERGAVAVEMALVLPVLILLLLGIMEFGRALNAQVILTNAARESVRVEAITDVQTDATQAALGAMSTLKTTASNPTVGYSFTKDNVSYTSCAAGRQVEVTITYSLSSLTGIAGPFSMTGKGVMLCGG